MPDFPRYLSKGQATTQQPSFMAPESTQGQITEQIAKVGQTAQNLTFKMAEAYSEAQKTQAELNQRTQNDDLLARAAADPDINAYDKYRQENEKVAKETKSGFKNRLTAGDALAKADYYAKTTDTQLQAVFRKKMIDNQQANLLGLLDKDAAIGDVDSIKSRIETNKSKGFISETDAYTLEQKYIKKTKQNAFLGDLNADPEEAEKNLSKNEYGFDFKELAAANKILKSEVGRIQATTQSDLLTSYLNGEEIDTGAIKTLMNQKRITPKFAESLINKIENPKPDEPSKDQSFIEFQNKISDLQEKGDKATTEEIVKFMADTVQAHSQGLLDKSDVQRILKDRNEILQKKLEGKAEDIMSKVKPKSLFERISFWSDEYADKKPEIKARMYRKLIDGMMQDGNGENLLRKVVDDEIEIQLQNNLKKPDSKMTKMLSPDGVLYDIPNENVEKAKSRGFKNA